jgi:hypothetical protein
MSATQVIEEINSLPAEEQQEVFAFLAQKMIGRCKGTEKPWLGRKLSFDEACDVVFRENRELLSLLAK